MTPRSIPGDDEPGWLNEDLDDDELEEFEQFDRLAEQSPPAKVLPDDLRELFGRIRDAAIVRVVCDPDSPWFMFDRFEAMNCVIGGIGMVIEARDPVLDRRVAIKLWQQVGPAAQMALLEEAKILAKPSHPNVVAVHETGCWRSRVFFVMPWVDGVDGHVWMQTPRTWVEVRDAFVEAGRGLAAAHDAGIQHRDFKPANMLVGDDGRVLVADFGLADSLDDAGGDGDGDERSGAPAGTPTYMAPERIRGERGDARSDQFSFCVALWRGLFGVRPFEGERGDELLHAIEAGQPRGDPAAVPSWLREVARKGLALDPVDRYADMHELVAALVDAPHGDPRRGDGGADVGIAGTDGERMLDPSGGGAATSPSAWVFVVSMLLVSATTLGVHGLVASRGPRQAATEDAGAPMTKTAASLVPESPCAGVELGERVDPVVSEVCQLIRNGHLEAAEMLWEREFDDRTTRAARDPNLKRDTVMVAATFVQAAEDLAKLEPAQARIAAKRGSYWSGRYETAEGIRGRANRILRGGTRQP